MVRIGMIWAQAAGGVIGAAGGMPWHVPEDLAHFKAVTLGAPVVMGRRTWESFPERFRPLPGRHNIVITGDPSWAETGAQRVGDPAQALAAAQAALDRRHGTGAAGDGVGGDGGTAEASHTDRIWVIGGGQVYRALDAHADRVEVTELDLTVPGDTHAPSVAGRPVLARDPAGGWHLSRGGVRYRFIRYGARAAD